MNISDELHLHIISYLTVGCFPAIARICKQFNIILHDEILWKRICKDEYSLKVLKHYDLDANNWYAVSKQLNYYDRFFSPYGLIECEYIKQLFQIHIESIHTSYNKYFRRLSFSTYQNFVRWPFQFVNPITEDYPFRVKIIKLTLPISIGFANSHKKFVLHQNALAGAFFTYYNNPINEMRLENKKNVLVNYTTRQSRSLNEYKYDYLYYKPPILKNKSIVEFRIKGNFLKVQIDDFTCNISLGVIVKNQREMNIKAMKPYLSLAPEAVVQIL